MPTIDAVHAAIATRAAANFTSIALRFQDTTTPLPDTPVPFAYVELAVDPANFIAYGGGRGNNLQRTTARIEAHFLVPTGSQEREDALAWAEAFCAVFRGERVNDISYGAAQAIPMNGKSEDGLYDHIATATIDLYWDQLG